MEHLIQRWARNRPGGIGGLKCACTTIIFALVTTDVAHADLDSGMFMGYRLGSHYVSDSKPRFSRRNDDDAAVVVIAEQPQTPEEIEDVYLTCTSQSLKIGKIVAVERFEMEKGDRPKKEAISRACHYWRVLTSRYGAWGFQPNAYRNDPKACEPPWSISHVKAWTVFTMKSTDYILTVRILSDRHVGIRGDNYYSSTLELIFETSDENPLTSDWGAIRDLEWEMTLLREEQEYLDKADTRGL